MCSCDADSKSEWFAMRDLSRPNAHVRAYDRLLNAGFEVFTPLHWVVSSVKRKRVRRKMPVIPDLLFVHAIRGILDTEVGNSATLQYRYVKGFRAKPMTVRDSEMQRFIDAVSDKEGVTYYRPEELSPSMIGKRVRVIGGPLDGYEGNLLYIRGSRKKRLIVEIPGFLTAAVEVAPEFVSVIV